MVLLTDHELDFLATLKDVGERLYRTELARLLKEEAKRRCRFEDKVFDPRGTGSPLKWARGSAAACSCFSISRLQSPSSRLLPPGACGPTIMLAARKYRYFSNLGKPRRTNSTIPGGKTMRDILIAALVVTVAVVVQPASASQLSAGVSAGEPALQTRKGRRYLCQEYLQAQGYPNSYVRQRSSRGLVGACARKLWRQWKHPQRV
jgi:hypothetical protein